MCRCIDSVKGYKCYRLVRHIYVLYHRLYGTLDTLPSRPVDGTLKDCRGQRKLLLLVMTFLWRQSVGKSRIKTRSQHFVTDVRARLTWDLC